MNRHPFPSAAPSEARTEAASHVATARYALTQAFRLLRADTVLGIRTETAGKTVTALLEAIEARHQLPASGQTAPAACAARSGETRVLRGV